MVRHNELCEFANFVSLTKRFYLGNIVESHKKYGSPVFYPIFIIEQTNLSSNRHNILHCES